MMLRWSELTQYPLLRKLIFQHLMLGGLGIGLVAASIVFVSSSRKASLIFELKEKVKSDLAGSQEKLRVWQQLGLREAIGGFQNDLGDELIGSLRVLPNELLDRRQGALEIRLPERPDPLLPYTVVAEVSQNAVDSKILPYSLFTFVLFAAGIIFFIAFIRSLKFILGEVYEPIKRILLTLRLRQTDEMIQLPSDIASGEILSFIQEIEFLYQQHLKYLNQEEELKRQQSLSNLAMQVAHDVRSPLVALQVGLHSAHALPEETRVLIRGAADRIQAIVNELVAHYKKNAVKQSNPTKSLEIRRHQREQPEMAAQLINDIVTEKRTELLTRKNFSLEWKIDSSNYGIFIGVDSLEFKRILSNLINNAVEALNGGGNVKISLFDKGQDVLIEVSDNGKGMTAEQLKSFGKKGYSFNKSHGLGLGVWNALQQVNFWGGDLNCVSEPGRGTIVSLRLPRLKTPPWFAAKLDLMAEQSIVIIDDDETNHRLWKDRLSGISHIRLENVFHFRSDLEVIKWVDGSGDYKQALFFVDYDLGPQSKTGFELIDELEIANQCVMVSHRFEDERVRMGCAARAIKLMPKAFVPCIPLSLV